MHVLLYLNGLPIFIAVYQQQQQKLKIRALREGRTWKVSFSKQTRNCKESISKVPYPNFQANDKPSQTTHNSTIKQEVIPILRGKPRILVNSLLFNP